MILPKQKFYSLDIQCFKCAVLLRQNFRALFCLGKITKVLIINVL